LSITKPHMWQASSKARALCSCVSTEADCSHQSLPSWEAAMFPPGVSGLCWILSSLQLKLSLELCRNRAPSLQIAQIGLSTDPTYWTVPVVLILVFLSPKFVIQEPYRRVSVLKQDVLLSELLTKNLFHVILLSKSQNSRTQSV
jgi:hypothetical protein